MGDDQVEQRRQVLARAFQAVIGPAVAADREHGGEVELVVIGVQRREQVETLVMDLVGPGIAAIHLVDHHDGAKPQAQGLAGDELGLGHRPLGGIHQHHHPIDHGQDPLDLAAEIGVTGSIDDIDADALPLDRGALGQNGDAALFFQIVGIHHALSHQLILAEGSRLPQHGVHQGGLAVVDVSDNGDVAKFHVRQSR